MKLCMKGIARKLAIVLVSLIILTACGELPAWSPRADVPTTANADGTATTALPSPTATDSTEFQFATADGPAQNVPVPDLPLLAKEFSQAGLEAFSEHWYTTLTYLYAAGDSSPMMAVGSPDCDFCVRVGESTSKGYTDGNWIVGGQQALYASWTDFLENPDGSYQARTWLQETKRTYYNADGSLAQDWPQKSRFYTIMMATFNDGHEIVQAVYLSGEEPKPLVYTEK